MKNQTLQSRVLRCALAVLMAVTMAFPLSVCSMFKIAWASDEGYMIGNGSATPDEIIAKGETYFGRSYASMDCAQFVGAVFNSFNSSFPTSYTGNIVNYGASVNAEKYRGTTKDGWLNNVEKGDVIVVFDGSYASGSSCHALIWAGDGKVIHSIAHGKYDGPSYMTFDEYWSANIAGDYGVKAGDRYIIYRGAASKGGINLHKASSNEDITGLNADGTDANGCYTRAGAVYEVFDNSWNLAWTLTTDAAGNASTGEKALKKGTYHVKEKTAPSGYRLDGTTYDVEVKPNEMASVNGGTVYDNPDGDPTWMGVAKLDTETGEANPQGAGTLEGAEFTVKYFDNTDGDISGTPLRTWVLKTNEQGITTLNDKVSGDDLYKDSSGWTVVPVGTISIQETKPPTGYLLPEDNEPEVQVVKSNGQLEPVHVLNQKIQREQVIRGGVSVEKRDIETKQSVALGGATLAGTQFQIVLKAGLGQYDVVVDGKTYSAGQVVKTIVTDENGKATTSENCLPYGTYTIQEVQASTGYLLTDGAVRTFDVHENGYVKPYAQKGEGGADTAWYNQVKRGDIEWVKIENGTNESYQNPLAGVPFIIRSKTTGEEHVVVSDANGIVKTQSDWNKHSYKTNGNDAAVTKQADGTYVVDETKLDAECGVWFGINSTVNDNLNALPYDDYEIQELSVRVNKGYRLVTKSFTIYKDKNNVNIGTITNEVEPFGGIKIYKTSSAPSALTLAGTEFGIYTDPFEKDEYLIRKVVTDETGLAVSADTFDLSGNTDYYIKELNAPTGYVAKDKFYHVFVTSQQWAVIGKEDNLLQNDPIYGGVSVEKKDAETNSFTGQGAATMDGTTFNIVNKNDYKVYVEGKWYNTGDVVKTLVTKDGKATTDEDCLPYGKYTIQEVKSGEGYTLGDGVPREFSIVQDGVILDTFTGDGAFTNTVIKGDVHLVKVAEIDQSRMANIVFKLTSLATGEVWTLTTDENGEAYTEGYALPYGKYKLEEIESKENEDYLMITLDEISISKDKTIVDLGTLVNKLRPDPTLSTTATDKADGDKVLALGGTQTVVDAVSFENLRTDRKYTMVGVLHYVNEDGSDGGEVEGSLSQVTFTPEAENGEVQVDLNVDTSNLEGKSIVVFEECRQHLVYEDEEADETVDETDTSLDVEADETDAVDETTKSDNEVTKYRVVATHMDIADEGQTVSVETMPDAMPDTGDKTMQFAFGLLALSAFSLLVASRRKVRED